MSLRINRLTVTFEDPKLEARYQHDVFPRAVKPFTRFSVVMTAKALEAKYILTARGQVDIKGKGLMKTWFLEGRKP